jgi:L-asparaginase
VTRSIAAFFLGGTISMSGHSGGAVVRLGADELVAAVPQLAALDVRILSEQFRSLPSAALSFDDIVELVGTAGARDVDGVVVVQGTDTLEETAYLIDLLWTSDVPVVVTGAMRNPSLAGADGPANLLAAVTVAASDAFRGQGALVVFSDEVHAARFARKAHSTSPATFASPNAGPIGHVIEGVARVVTRVERGSTYQLDGSVRARVPIVSVAMDDGGEVLVGLAERCDGVVVAALGAGHVPPGLAEPLGALAQAMPVVLTSRTGAGSVLTHTYGYVGSETDLRQRGLIIGGLLDPAKARVLLRVLLTSGQDRGAIADAFAAAG